MSVLDDAISSLTEDHKAGLEGSNYAAVTGVRDLGIVLEWVKRVREKNPFLIGDRVAMAQLDPEDEDEPRTGEVIGFASGGALLIRPDEGEYADSETGLWYMENNVERIDS